MKNNKGGIIFVSSLLLIGGGVGYWLWRRAKKKKELEAIKTQYSINESLALVKQKFGDSAVIGTNPTDKMPNDVILVFFNDKKNKAQFYGRGDTLFIFDNTVKPPKVLVNGTYSKGGTNIKLENGKEIKNKDSLLALQDTIK
tara:strand:- start:121 stop:546 length:426 start_codon:yes stop_codon:yes gene_type:complete